MNDKDYIEILQKQQETTSKALDTLNNIIEKNNRTNRKNNRNFCIVLGVIVALLSTVMLYFTYSYFNYTSEYETTSTQTEQITKHIEGGE